MDYRGTNGNDNIDQKALGLADWTNFYGGAGNDTIRVGNATAIGEAGDDTIIGTTHYSTVAYWGSPAGVTVNLATGIAQDGFGGTDHLSGIYVVQASGFSDRLIGSSADETFWLSGGNDSVTGGGGHDKVIYYGVKASQATVTYSAATDTFTVVRNPANGDRGTDTLQGVEAIWFEDTNGAVEAVTRDMFVEQAGFRRSTEHTAVTNMAGAAQLKAGDFNGDGITDVMVSRVNWADVGATAVPLQIFLGDGKGSYADGTAQVFAAGSAYVHFVPRIFVADFNKDGVTDIFTPDFGIDGQPYPGGQNGLFLSSPTSHQLVNATSTLPQGLRQNHGTSLGDINGDGYLDILVNALNDLNGQSEDLLVNDGTGHFVSNPSLLPAFLKSSANVAGHTWSMIGDLNGDGAADIVLGTWDVNPAPSQVLLNNGHGSFANAVPIDLPRSGVDKDIVVGIETIDLNGDALPDLVLSVTNGGAGTAYQVPYLQFLVNDGNGRFHDETQARLPQSKTFAPGATPDWYLSTQVVDLNNDGFQDIVVDDAGGGGPSKVLMNDGHGVFTPGYETVVGSHLTVADVDRDGMPDLIGSSQNGFDVLYNTMANGHMYSAPKVGEAVLGSQLADTMRGAVNSGRIDGGGGLDTLIYQGVASGYKITHGAAGFTVSHGAAGMADTLLNVERIKFADTMVALDIGGVGGQAYRIYQAAFDRAPDSGGLGYWIAEMDRGFTLTAVAQLFVDSPEFKGMYGTAPANADLVNKFYEHVLHRPAEKAGLDYWTGLLDSHAATVADVLVAISESGENQSALAAVIGNGFSYTPYG